MKNLGSLLVIFMVAFFAVFAIGCGGRLLPSSTLDVKSPWKNYAAAEITYKEIVPNKTTGQDLKKMGIDPRATPNILILSPKDLVSIYMPNPSISIKDLDPGIQECFANRNKCTGYLIAPSALNRDSLKSNFWLHFFGFKRIFRDTGWEFSGLIILVDNIVVYKEPVGGKPMIDKEETIKKPLGPLQDGDQMIDTTKKFLIP